MLGCIHVGAHESCTWCHDARFWRMCGTYNPHCNPQFACAHTDYSSPIAPMAHQIHCFGLCCALVGTHAGHIASETKNRPFVEFDSLGRNFGGTFSRRIKTWYQDQSEKGEGIRHFGTVVVLSGPIWSPPANYLCGPKQPDTRQTGSTFIFSWNYGVSKWPK